MTAFLSDFDVTWAKREEALGSEVSAYLLKPQPHMDRAFGFNAEILAIYSPYKTLESRAMVIITDIMAKPPVKGRVDPKVAFLISDAPDPAEWVANYVAQQDDLPIVAAFGAAALRQAAGNSWAVRRTLADQLYVRDLFAQDRLPIKSDSFFFGRAGIVHDLTNAYHYSEDRGLFGLRKSGKTSIFLKVQRGATARRDAAFVLIDCKLPEHRNLHWQELLHLVAHEIVNETRARLDLAELDAKDAFVKAVRYATASGRLILVFDEVENITPLSRSDLHWKDDFVPFWQTVLHVKSEVNSLSIFLGGVNAAIVDKAEFDGVQNPLFTVFSSHYVAGMAEQEIGTMVRALGRPMGFRLDHSAVRYLRERYGGHPQLTKQACSIAYRMLRESGQGLPADVGEKFLRETEQERDAELSDHAGLVLLGLEEFYLDEFELLSEIAAGSLADVYEFVSDPSFSAHLKNYGLLAVSDTGRPTISIGVIERSLRARIRGGRIRQPISPPAERVHWLQRRTTEINRRLEQLHQEIRRTGRPWLFGPNNYPNSHEFLAVSVVSDEATFGGFISTLYKCFVESVQRFGQTSSRSDHFTKVVPATYPELNKSLNRIRSYRHYTQHQTLTPDVAKMNREFLLRDLGKVDGPKDGEQWFMLQECTLNELLVAILTELDQLG